MWNACVQGLILGPPRSWLVGPCPLRVRARRSCPKPHQSQSGGVVSPPVAWLGRSCPSKTPLDSEGCKSVCTGTSMCRYVQVCAGISCMCMYVMYLSVFVCMCMYDGICMYIPVCASMQVCACRTLLFLFHSPKHALQQGRVLSTGRMRPSGRFGFGQSPLLYWHVAHDFAHRLPSPCQNCVSKLVWAMMLHASSHTLPCAFTPMQSLGMVLQPVILAHTAQCSHAKNTNKYWQTAIRWRCARYSLHIVHA